MARWKMATIKKVESLKMVSLNSHKYSSLHTPFNYTVNHTI